MLSSSWKSRLLISSVLLAVLIGCGSEAKKITPPSSGSPTSTKNGNTNTDDTEQPDADAGDIDIPDMINQMKWEIVLNNRGKIYTGFNATTPFKVLVYVGVYGSLPKNVQSGLKEEQLKAIYSSKDYHSKMESEVSKIAFQGDSAFFTVKQNEISSGRSFELTTLKSGTAQAKVTWEKSELPVTITIANYTTAQLTAGRNRYNTAVTGATPSPSCASCHRQAGGANHSPLFMSTVSDAAMLAFIETGKNPDTSRENAQHTMKFANATDKAGIVAYLRSLDPNELPVPKEGEGGPVAGAF